MEYGEFDVEDNRHSGRLEVYEDTDLKILSKEDSSQTQKERTPTLHYIRSESESNFTSFKILRNDSKVEKLVSIYIEADRH